MKNLFKKVIVYTIALLTLSMQTIPVVSADVSYIGFDQVFGGVSTGGGDNDCSRPKGSRTSNSMYGYRVSLLRTNCWNSKKENCTPTKAETIAIYDKLYNQSSTYTLNSKTNKLGQDANGNYAKNSEVSGIDLGKPNNSKSPMVIYNDADEVKYEVSDGSVNVIDKMDEIIKDADELYKALNNSDYKKFRTVFPATDYYKLMIRLAGIAGDDTKALYMCSSNGSKDPNGNCSSYDADKLKAYLRLIDNTYISVEPILTIRTGDPNAWYQDKALCKSDIEKIEDIKGSIEKILEWLGKTYEDLCTGCTPHTSYYGVCMDNCKTGVGTSYTAKIQELLNQLKNTDYTYFTDTITNLAKKDYTGYHVEEVNWEAMSVYITGQINNTKFPYFREVSSKAAGKSLIKDSSYSYGINIIHLDFDSAINDEKCSYKTIDGELKLRGPAGWTEPPEFCCEENDHWEDYDASKSEGQRSKQWKEWVNSDDFIKNYKEKSICPDTNEYDSCTETQYNDIISGKNLDTTKLTFKTKKNGKDTTVTQSLRVCCSYDAYKDKDGKNTLTISETEFNSNVAKYCNCTYEHYEKIKKEVKDGNTDILEEFITDSNGEKVKIDGEYRKYSYCCDEEPYHGSLEGKVTNFNKFKKKYCNPKNSCGLDEFNLLMGFTSDDPNNSTINVAGNTDPKYCCYIDNYTDEELNTTVKNKLLKSYFLSNGILDTDYCKQPCTFTDTIAKGIRYKDGVISEQTDCCKWSNYGDTEQKRKENSVVKKGKQTIKKFNNEAEFNEYILKNEEYKKVCPDTNEASCSIDDLKLILNGQMTNPNKIKTCCYITGYKAETLNSVLNGKIVKNYFTEEGNKRLDSPLCPNDYCTLESVKLGRVECCKNINLYSKADKDKYRNEAGLKSALISKYGSALYYAYCPSTECEYEVSDYCPDCSIDGKDSGFTADTIRGEDTTKLDVDENIKNCIIENEDYYSQENELSSPYCEVYCTQKVEYNYPKKTTLQAQSGRFILVGGQYGYPGRFAPIQTKAVTTCRVKQVNNVKFKKDLKDAVEEFKEAYKAYSNALVPLENIGSTTDIINTVDESGKVSGAVCSCNHWQRLGTSYHDEECCSSKSSFDVTNKSNMNVATVYHNTYNATSTQGYYTTESECTSNGGSWITTETEISYSTVSADNSPGCTTACTNMGGTKSSYSIGCSDGKTYSTNTACRDAAEGNKVNKPGSCTCKITSTKTLDNPYCSKRPSPSYSCNDSDYELVGTKCVYNKTAGKDCTSTSSGYACSKYSCKSTYSYSGETGYLNSSNSVQGEVNNPKCQYDYCSQRNYDRFKYQTVSRYNYGANLAENQSARNTKQCEFTCSRLICTNYGCGCTPNPNYYETAFEKTKRETKARLDAAKARYEQILKDYSKCFNVAKDMMEYYDIDIDLRLDYNNSIYSTSTKLARTPNTSVDPKADYTLVLSDRYEQCELSLDYKKLNCATNTLKNKGQDIKVFENFNRINSVSVEKSYDYTLPDDLEIYTKVNKNSVSKLSSDNELNNVNMFKHLPVAYNEQDNEIELTLTPEVNVDKIKREEFRGKMCTDEYFCSNRSIAGCIIPVYRPIDLNDPFPDQDDAGRQTGINWCANDATGCSNKNTLVQHVVTNNRFVTTYDVYNLTPLYTIRLTPPMLKKIRDYNETTTYGDYNLICDSGTGRHCISLYLRGEPNENGLVIPNNLMALGAVKVNQSCALDEMKNSSKCKPNDHFRTRKDRTETY